MVITLSPTIRHARGNISVAMAGVALAMLALPILLPKVQESLSQPRPLSENLPFISLYTTYYFYTDKLGTLHK